MLISMNINFLIILFLLIWSRIAFFRYANKDGWKTGAINGLLDAKCEAQRYRVSVKKSADFSSFCLATVL